jgi:hypothetical protein
VRKRCCFRFGGTSAFGAWRLGKFSFREFGNRRFFDGFLRLRLYGK